MIDSKETGNPLHVKEEILSDDDWQYNMAKVSPDRMKVIESPKAKIKSPPNQSSNISNNKKKKKDYLSNDKKAEESQTSHAASYSQDIIESSQSTVTCKKKKKFGISNSDVCNVRKHRSNDVDQPKSLGERASVEISPNKPESPIEFQDKILKKKKTKKKKRMSFTADTENNSSLDLDVIKSENWNYPNSDECNRLNLRKASQKLKLKSKRKSPWDNAPIDILPIKKERPDDLEALNNSHELEDKTIKPNKLSPSVTVEDFVTESDLLKRKKIHKAQITVKKRKLSNTLLAMIHNSTSSSDSDENTDEFINMETELEMPTGNKRCKVKQEVETEFNTPPAMLQYSSNSSDSDNVTQVSKPCRSHGIIESDDSSNEGVVEKPTTERSKSGEFDLEAEAEDIAELIISIEAEEQIPSETARKLQKIHIQFRHTVPPQHKVETCAGSRGPTKEQKETMEKFGPIKKGSFTPEEDDLIVKNWKAFCKMHDWDVRDVKPFLYMRHQRVGCVVKFSERQKFVQFLADGLPWRTLYSVYWRFRNLYQPHRQFRYTKDEDTLIIAHMENSSAINEKNVRKFSELAKLLNRTRASVWRRYRLLKKKRNRHERTEWDLNVVKKMIKNLMKLTLSEDISQLKDLDIPLVVWKRLSNILKIDYDNLKQFWLTKLHMQLFCEGPVYLNDVKIKLIEYFYVKGISEWWEIEWSHIAKHFDGMTSRFLSKIFGHLVHDEKFEDKELREILEYLYNVKKQELQRAPMDKTLPRIVYKNGTVKLIETSANDRPNRKKIRDSSD